MFAGTAAKVLEALQPYGLKQEGANEWRCNSSLRPGSNSHGFKLTIHDDEFGAYLDHAREGDPDAQGSLYQLAEKLGIPTPKAERIPVEDTKRGYRDLADYAAAHGVTADVLKAAGWGESEMVFDHDHQKERPALPFVTAAGKRYRFIDGLSSHYKSPGGYKACLYGVKNAFPMAREKDLPIVICNGEASTVVAQHYGIPAICQTGGERGLAEDNLKLLQIAWQGDMVIAFDCDEKGRHAAKLIKAQFPHATVIDLGLSDKGDLGDFCKLFTDKAADELLKRVKVQQDKPKPPSDLQLLAQATADLTNAIRSDAKAKQSADLEIVTAKLQAELDRIKMATAKPLIISFAELAADNMALIDERMLNPDAITGLRSNIPSLDKAVGGFEPEMYVIYGATSMGKSTLAASMAREFLRQGPGFIATTESNPRRWMIKLVASMCKIPSDKIETGQLSKQEYECVKDAYSNLRRMGCHMLQSGSPTGSLLRSAIREGIDRYGYEWCIVDSASKMEHPGAAGVYDRMSGVANNLQSLWQEFNIPFIVTTQVGRDVGERGAGKKMPQLEDGYGSGVIEHNAGVVLALYNHQYYVELGTEEMDDNRFPPNTALVRILKNRWRGDARIAAVRLAFVGGSGFYECETRLVDTRREAIEYDD